MDPKRAKELLSEERRRIERSLRGVAVADDDAPSHEDRHLEHLADDATDLASDSGSLAQVALRVFARREEVDECAADGRGRAATAIAPREDSRTLGLPADGAAGIHPDPNLLTRQRITRHDLGRLSEHEGDAERIDGAHRVHLVTRTDAYPMPGGPPREGVRHDDLARARVAVDEVLARELVEGVSGVESETRRRLTGRRCIRYATVGEAPENPPVKPPLSLAEPREPGFSPPLGRDSGCLERLRHPVRCCAHRRPPYPAARDSSAHARSP